jgi:hypothetical protein
MVTMRVAVAGWNLMMHGDCASSECSGSDSD